MFSKKFENKFTWEWYEKVKGNGAYVCIFWVHFNSFKIFSSEQSLYSALNILLLDLKSVKCVCIETAQTWTYFTYFTYFIYIDIHNRTLGIVWIDIQITILLYLLKKRNMQQLTMDNTKYNIRIYWKEDHMPFRNLRRKIKY